MAKEHHWQWDDVRRVNHLACVDAYYGGRTRVKHESLQAPQQAYLKSQPPVIAAAAAVSTGDERQQNKAQQRAKRKRKREQVRHEELIAAGKFVPVDEALQCALARAHSELLGDASSLAALQPVVASCSEGIPVQHESAQQLAAGSLHSNETDSVQIARTTDGHDVLLPARCSFILGDVRKLPCGDGVALGQFQLIVIDPPWENKSVARSKKYATFHHTELLKIDVPALTDPDECVLAIWVTNRPQYTAFILETLLPQWGFTLHDTWFWLKVCANGDLVTPIESSHRLPFEKMVVAYRCADPGRRCALEKRLGKHPKLLLSIPLRHSWKPPPESFFNESVVAKDARKLELFARELRPRWTSVGNEASVRL